jgi:hypothetical protein
MNRDTTVPSTTLQRVHASLCYRLPSHAIWLLLSSLVFEPAQKDIRTVGVCFINGRERTRSVLE